MKFKIYKYIASSALVAFLGLLSSPAAASSSTSGLVSFIYAYSSGSSQVVFFNQGGTRSALPSCATYSPPRWVLDITTTAGQAALAILMTAAASGHQVIVSGTGTCSVWGDTETVINVVYL